MASVVLSNPNKPTTMRLRVTYSTSTGSFTLTKLEGCRTDAYTTRSDRSENRIKVNVAGTTKELLPIDNKIEFPKNSAYKTMWSDSQSWSCSGDVSVKVTFTCTLENIKNASFSTTISVPVPPPPYAAPSIKVHTASTNNTSGDQKWASWQSWGSSSWDIQTSSKSYAGDNFTFNWQVSNTSNGVDANPDTRLSLFRRDNASYTTEQSVEIYCKRDWGSTASINSNYDRQATTDDCGKYLVAGIRQDWDNSAGTRQYKQIGRGHYIQPEPSLGYNVLLRTTRFYTGTPSCMVYHLVSWNVTSNGYGLLSYNSNDSGITGSTTVTNNIVGLHLDVAGNGVMGSFHYGTGPFNGNYSLPTWPLEFHSTKFTPKSSAQNTNAFAYTNYYNPRTGSVYRLGYLSSPSVPVSVVSGSVNLPVIDSIKPSSGNGTTEIVESTKHIWTTLNNVIINWKVNHSGNSHGFGYDARVSEDSGSYRSSTVTTYSTSMVPCKINSWNGNYGGIDLTGSTFALQHDSIPESGSVRKALIVPYITDSAGYKIFGEKTRSYVESDGYTIYKIRKPNAPTLNKWSNTLPAIDGIRDRISWEATSPSNWGNVTDFSRGYKLKYKIGKDTSRSDGWQWSYISTPTTTSTGFSGSLIQTYDRATNTSCSAAMAATTYYSDVWNGHLDFQSSYTAEKSFTISPKTPYSATSGTLTTPKATTLSTIIPYTFKCPDQTINGNIINQTTKVSIDGGTAKSIQSPTYTMGTPNSLTGNLKLTFNNLDLSTEALARGFHTIVVTNEVSTYFDSSTPVENHVYFGNTTVTSNTLNVEVAELPEAPTIATPSPQYYKAGGYRKFRFEWTPGDWGCLDTAYNDIHYDYELLDPDGNIISSGTPSKTQTSLSWSFLMTSPTHEGTYTFRLRQTSVVGSSDWSSQTMEIQKAIEPEDSAIEATDILALPNWQWNLKINPGTDGSYNALPSTMPATSYWFQTTRYLAGGTTLNPPAANFERSIRTELKLASQDLTNKTSTVNYSIYTENGTNANNYTSGTVSTKTNVSNTNIILDGSNVYTQSGTTYVPAKSVLDSGSITINHNKNTAFDQTSYYDGIFTGSSSSNIGGTDVTGLLKGMALPATPDSRVECRYKVEVVQPSYADTLLGTESYTGSSLNIESLNNSNYIGEDIWYDYGDGSVITQETAHTYTNTDTYTISIYNRKISSYTLITTISNWSTINNGVSLNRDYTTNLNGYEDGSYKMLITYERNYTAKTVREQKFFDIIPPEVKLYNSSRILSCTENSDDILYQIALDVYAGTDISEAWYSMDYGKTWNTLNVARTDGAHKWFEKQINLTWLDEIWYKVHGKNPVSEKNSQWTDELPSDYKIYLSWTNKEEHKLTEDFHTEYIYNHDEIEEMFVQGPLALWIDGSMTKEMNPRIYAGFRNVRTNKWVNEDGTDYAGIGVENILSSDNNYLRTFNISQAVLDNRDVEYVIGFHYDKGSIIPDNLTFIPAIYQDGTENLIDINNIFSMCDLKGTGMKYTYDNGTESVTQGTCTITNNKDGSFTISRETKSDENIIRRIAMSYNGTDSKKIRRIKKL